MTMFKSKIKKLKKQNTIFLEGDLTIQSSNELKEVFVKAITGAQALALNMENVTMMDITSLQLLCSLIKTSQKQNQTELRVDGELPQAFKEIANKAGYLQYSDCHLTGGSFLWVKGDN